MSRTILTDEQAMELTKKSLERSIERRKEEERKRVKELFQSKQQSKPADEKKPALTAT